MNKIKLLSLIFLVSLQVKAEVPGEFKNYIAKLIEKPIQVSNFNELNYKKDKSLEKWLSDADKKLDTSHLMTYKGYFKISIDSKGYVDGFEIIELDEYNLERFKEFVASILAIDFKKLGKNYSENYYFDLDGDLLYLDRNYETNQEFDFAIEHNKFDDFVSLIESKDSINASLLEPKQIDYPALGEELVFKINSQDELENGILKLKVLDINKKAMSLSLDSFIKDHNQYFGDMAFEVARPKNSRASLTRVMSAGFAAAAQAGFEGSFLSYGLLPGAFAALSIGDTLVKERVTLTSFNLTKGDQVMLNSKKRRVKQ